ncbi:MAG: hypothetical protein EP343_05110 [Deltaproteobacteria bacterium]|nr:MAG: hypothetical protein EP343_05110 [Deltaproteobacteria bacterium]
MIKNAPPFLWNAVLRWCLFSLLGGFLLLQPVGCGNEVVQPTETGGSPESGTTSENSGTERTSQEPPTAEPSQESNTGQEPSAGQEPNPSEPSGAEPQREAPTESTAEANNTETTNNTEPSSGAESTTGEAMASDAGEATSSEATPEATPEPLVELPPEQPPFEGNPNQVSITVRDDAGKPVTNATVRWNQQTLTTDTQGFATLNANQVTAPYTIHVFHKGYAYFSAFGVKRNHLFVQLAPNRTVSKPGKVKGTFDFSKLQAALNIPANDWATRTVSLGVAGLSFRANLLDIDLRVILGEPVLANLLNQSVDMPSGLVLGLAGAGKPNYEAPGQPGRRVLWGFGGKFKLADIIPLIPNNPNNVSMAQILGKAKPLFASMGFGANDNVQLQSNVTQTQNLTLQHKLAQKLTIKATNVPSIQHNGKRENLLVLGLVMKIHPTFGVTPIGLTADEGSSSSLTLDVNYVQPPTNELKRGPFAVMTLALTAPAGNNPPPSVLFANVRTFTTLPTQLAVSSFPTLGTQAVFAPSTRSLTKGNISGASFHQLDITNAQGRWTVMYPSGQQGFTLPAVPTGFSDPVSTGSVAFFRTAMLQSGHTYDSILENNRNNMDAIATLLDGFSSCFVYP